ncbi:hypothetical protein SB00610_04411 [Klebsiella quasipneumoniae subsp. similipneumoniae]|nr:hypothetical protein SB00610_04411 [Klebsiella quasipneumoniae subsp. similipneumoniae]
MLAIAHARLGGDKQCFTGFCLHVVAVAVAILRFAFQNQVQDIDFWVRSGLEGSAWRQHFLIENA